MLYFAAVIHQSPFYTGEAMSTSTIISADEFQALEQKVLRAVEIVKREREARAAAEAEVATLRTQLATQLSAHSEELSAVQGPTRHPHSGARLVRQRVEKMPQPDRRTPPKLTRRRPDGPKPRIPPGPA